MRTCVLTASTENRLREGGVRTEGPRTARVPRSGDRPGTEWGTIATCSYADSGARLLVREARSALCASSRPVHLLRTVRQVQDAVCLTEALLGPGKLLPWMASVRAPGHHRVCLLRSGVPAPTGHCADGQVRSHHAALVLEWRVTVRLRSGLAVSVVADCSPSRQGAPGTGSCFPSPVTGSRAQRDPEGRAGRRRDWSSCRDVGNAQWAVTQAPQQGPPSEA